MTDPALLAVASLWLLSLLVAVWLARRGGVPGALYRETGSRLQDALAQAGTWRGEAEQAKLQLAVETERTARLEIVERSLDQSHATEAKLGADLAAAAALATQERAHAAASLKLLQETREQMTLEFGQLAHRVTAQHSETFKTQNKEQMDALLAPMREKITEFHGWLATTHKESIEGRAGLAEHLKLVLQHGATMTEETAKLTRALKGDVRQQGAWGEMILEALLERSGLTRGEHYEHQGSITGDEGQRLRPDIVLHLTTEQCVVIDSKVSLTAFDGFVNAESDAAKQTHLGAHRTSLRSHIDGLAKKNYADATGSRIGFVVMFVPVENALATAMQADPGLAAYAYERNIGIATPVTLLMVLRTIHTVWRSEQRNTNAEKIAERAGFLYDKFQGFAEDLLAVGRALDTAKKSHDAALGKLSDGPGNLVGQIEKLKKLGAKTGKTVPAALVAAANEE